MPSQLVHKHTLNQGGMDMESPSKVVYSNNGQTKVTLRGKWFFMSPEEIEADYLRRLEEGDPVVVRINETLCRLQEKYGYEE